MTATVRQAGVSFTAKHNGVQVCFNSPTGEYRLTDQYTIVPVDESRGRASRIVKGRELTDVIPS